MPGKKRVNENVEVVDVVAEATEKKGLFTQLAKGVQGAGSWCRRHWKGIAIGVAGLGAGLWMGGKLMEEDEEEVAYLLVDGVEIELAEVTKDEDEESESDEQDEEEEAEDNDEEETED